MKKIYFFAIGVLMSAGVFAQPGFTWAKQVGVTGALTQVMSTTTDASGNVYCTGRYELTTDFDPGPGIFNLTSAGNYDGFILKLDPAGNFVWAKSFGGTNLDFPRYITLDGSGNILITGEFIGTSDFDPSASTFNMTSVTATQDIFVLKLNSSGSFVWAKQMGGTVADNGVGIAVDATGNVYTTGIFAGTSDFDPSASVSNLTSAGSNDIFISKLNASGNYVWAVGIGGTGADGGQSITVDASGNVYSTGSFQNTADFDPSASTFNMTSAGNGNVYVSKLTTTGTFVWAKQMGGPSGGTGFSIALDATGNIHTSGGFAGVFDFDPSAATFNITAFGPQDIFVSKLNSTGNFVWAKQMGGAGSNSYARCLALDASGNIYTTGVFDATVDFDPGASTFNLTSNGFGDAYISKLDPSGNYVWAGKTGGTGSELGTTITIDNNSNIICAGTFQNNVDFDASSNTFTLTANGSPDAFIEKYCSGGPAQPAAISGSISMCAGSGASNYSIAAVATATSYAWTLPAGWSGTSTTNIISATPGSSGIFTVTASNACGSSPQQTLNVTINPLPTITVNSGSICSGNSFTIVPSGASTYTIQGGSAIVSPGSTTSYTVIGTSTAGCVSASSATSNVTVNTTPTISMASGTICPGGSFTLSASGASTYTYSSGPVVSPAVTTTYSAIGSSTAGCNSASTTAVVTVTNNLVVSISGTNTICSGQNLNLTANGASTYTWNTSATTNTIAPTPTANTTYSVIGASGTCSNTAMINVTVNPTPIITASTSSSLICWGQVAQLSASGATSYTWNPGASTGASISVSPTVATVYTVTGTNASGCSSSATVSQNAVDCTNLSELTKSNSDFSIYPNPTSNRVTLSGVEGQPILIYNVIGEKIISTHSPTYKLEIDLSAHASGIYFIKVGTATKKIIKE